MKDHQLPALLARAVDEVPEPQLAEQAWARGRRERRRRRVAGFVGSLAAAAVVALAVVQTPLQAGLLHPTETQQADPAGTGAGLLLEPPEGVDPEYRSLPLWDELPAWMAWEREEQRRQGHELWASLWTACLEDRGYAVSPRGTALQLFRSEAGPGDHSRAVLACGEELRTETPLALDSGQTMVDVPLRSVLMNRWFVYDWTRQCLEKQGLPTAPRPYPDQFIAVLGWWGLPLWHPYQAMVEQGRYAEARDLCPIG